MLMNYIRITLRILKRQKVYSFINIAGLTLGLACFILISLWARHEMSYDRFHVKKDSLFRILNAIDNGNIGASVSYALGPGLKRKYPEIEDSCRVWPWQRSLVTYKDKKFDELNIYLTDPSFFTMFTFPFVKGNAKTALSDLNSLVITEDTAGRGVEEQDRTVQGTVPIPQNPRCFSVLYLHRSHRGDIDRIKTAPVYSGYRFGT